MAILQRINHASSDRQEQLLERLYHEWQAQHTGEEEPLIIEETPRRGESPNHLYVVWSDWTDLSPLERSRTIMQAYEKYRGREIADRVTLAMGLTPDEARKMNIKF